jgi:hypothetical protein
MPPKGATKTESIYFNGINGATGEYGLAPMSAEELSKLIVGEPPPENRSELQYRHRQQGEAHFGVKEGVDPKKLDESGWGVVFAPDVEPAVRAALRPLLELRKDQAGARFKVYDGTDGYRKGESKGTFLARNGVGPGPADPDRVPYYLLLVGSPSAIPFRFQSQLDVQYAVGRIHFDSVSAYAAYAESVVAAETRKLALERRLSFFGVAREGDRATELSRKNLVTPLFDHFRKRPGWKVEAFLDSDATKQNLARVLGGSGTPALVFSASHGIEFPEKHPLQLSKQGALLCADWPGPEAWRGKGALPPEFYFAGDDVAKAGSLLGLVSFLFACYGAGTPELDDFSKQFFRDRKALAPHPFLANLPKKMLGHPHGGALAVIGHVDRAWGYSFQWSKAGPQTTVFESTLERLLDGHPVGSALEFFNERYAELSTVLSDELEEIEFRKKYDPYELAGLWTANNDARGYVILGDPAVRLPVAGKDEPPTERPVIEVRAWEAEAEAEAVSFAVDAADEGSVHFRAYHPRAVVSGVWEKLLVYAHLAGMLDEVERDAGQILGREAGTFRKASAPSSMAIAPGTAIVIVPRGEGLEFDPAERVVTWADGWQRTDFQLRAGPARIGHVSEGSIEFYVGPLLVGAIRLQVVVMPQEEQGKEPTSGPEIRATSMYRSVFASYSHADSHLVEAVEKAYQALGMDYLRDVMSLKTGQSWSDELLRKIEEADVFQLFWSANASRSAYVEQEWRHAIRQRAGKGATFIRPVYWEDTLAPVPAELSQIHFARVDFARFLKPATAVAAEPDEDLMTLNVSTYLGEGKDATLAVRTRISISGDFETHVYREGNESLLTHHQEMVREALKTRLAYLAMKRGQ